MKPESNVRRKIKALEQRKAQLDALIAFIRRHPITASDAMLIPLNSRPGLYIYDTAIIRPLTIKDKILLRLEKRTEDYLERPDWAEASFAFDTSKLTVCEDVSKITDKRLQDILDELYEELHPDED